MSDVRIATIGSSAIAERFVDALEKIDGVSYVFIKVLSPFIQDIPVWINSDG